ncbi:hypothetical protein AMTR_s00076p00156580 [Amborella trichopoda]|uniref:Uncharacterized protein n=1 Tax=Amborella trichopoda TaxID=13333 RepID=W1PCF2_AMBTC|nr:hypothetical protein AMTR_s00076p00156580 [Amborella trichopoda]
MLKGQFVVPLDDMCRMACFHLTGFLYRPQNIRLVWAIDNLHLAKRQTGSLLFSIGGERYWDGCVRRADVVFLYVQWPWVVTTELVVAGAYTQNCIDSLAMKYTILSFKTALHHFRRITFGNPFLRMAVVGRSPLVGLTLLSSPSIFTTRSNNSQNVVGLLMAKLRSVFMFILLRQTRNSTCSRANNQAENGLRALLGKLAGNHAFFIVG